MIYIFGFAIGYGPIPWAMNAELFPKEAQGIMAPIAGGFNWLCAFIVTKFGTNLEDVINTSGLYFLFGAVNAFGLIFVILFLPETKGTTLAETIEDIENLGKSKGPIRNQDGV